MWTVIEANLPLVLMAGATAGLLLFLVVIAIRRRVKKQQKQPLSLISLHSQSSVNSGQLNGRVDQIAAPFLSPTWFSQLCQAPPDEQLRLLLALTPDQQEAFIGQLDFEVQARLWATLALETWAAWLAKPPRTIACEPAQLRQILTLCNRHFRAWATAWDGLSAGQQSRLWVRLDLAQQELLWQRLTALRRSAQRQDRQRHRQLAAWDKLSPEEQINLWLVLNQAERLDLWKRYQLSLWVKLWLSLDGEKRARLWGSLNQQQRIELRRYLEQLVNGVGSHSQIGSTIDVDDGAGAEFGSV
jgi:hypothetical protein